MLNLYLKLNLISRLFILKWGCWAKVSLEKNRRYENGHE